MTDDTSLTTTKGFPLLIPRTTRPSSATRELMTPVAPLVPRLAVAVVALGVALHARATCAGALLREEVACREVPEDQRDAKILMNPDTIRSIHALNPIASEPGRRRGVRIVLTAAPGLTADGLQRIADCHMARIAAMGSPSGSTRFPLDVKGASVVVKAHGDSFLVDIASVDERTARTIVARAQALRRHRAKAR
jgi:hypothetical protein